MAAPELKEEQKAKFKVAFAAIIEQAPDEVRKLWHGNIVWIADIPHPDNSVHMKLTGKLLNDYVILSNKLKGRSL